MIGLLKWVWLWQYGEDALKEGMGSGGPGGPMADIFDLFNAGGRGSRSNRERRGENVMHQLKVSLEDMYNGSTRSEHV